MRVEERILSLVPRNSNLGAALAATPIAGASI